MFKLKKLFIIIFLFITTIIPQEKLSFSALSMQGKTINGQKVEIFKKNVQVTYKGMILYSDIATHYKEKQKVISQKEIIFRSTISINTMSHDSDTRLIANGPVRARN